ncbi:MAG: hypothetical protein ACRDJL_00260 [Actinomycetota bacterium]
MTSIGLSAGAPREANSSISSEAIRLLRRALEFEQQRQAGLIEEIIARRVRFLKARRARRN